jgi:hypothetical protein
MWGPDGFSGPMLEAMLESPGGARLVQYFDKSRMEITTSPDVDPASAWYVTNGLLAKELVSGQLQLGLDTFETRAPALVNVAGDAGDPNGPTYATFGGLLGVAPMAAGTALTQRLDRSGVPSDDPALASYGVTAAYLVTETNHTVAGPFWEFMNARGVIYESGQFVENSLFPNPFYATGLPITEAYWTTVQVGGQPRDVLVQVFERRVLTYTPANAPEWRVEAGNVGRHYYGWRYGAEIPVEPPSLDGIYQALGPAPLPELVADAGGQALLTVANFGSGPLRVELSGPVSTSIVVPSCPECGVLNEPPTNCASAPAATTELPPGTYTIRVTRPNDGVADLGGVWTFVPNAGYGVCFFVIER